MHFLAQGTYLLNEWEHDQIRGKKEKDRKEV